MINRKFDCSEVHAAHAQEKNTSPKIYVQIRKMLLLGIVIALGLSLGVSFLLNLIQESRSRDQTLSSAAQVAANTPVLMEDIHHTQATEYIRRTVRNVPSIDVFAVYDKSGAPVAFYDLASGADDPGALNFAERECDGVVHCGQRHHALQWGGPLRD